ncbi:hypothetical protein Bca52824_002233 [Brassica carinata]|uniref:Ataxin-10 domain-containing protein n=1 Tax=Brassica carinata TaxID=52824 RepID=A0A8X7WHJ3_BRACI|nr:hypothetical protein Bca52824_002233 [Brassica carinata]
MEASIPEQVRQPLLLASNNPSHSLEECLEFLIEASKTDSGRSDLASKAILPSIIALLQLLPYPSSRHHLNLSLKVLRNLCAGETSNQEAFVNHNGSVVLSELLNSASGDVETVRFGLQVLANVVVMGENRQRDVWLHFFPEKFLSIAKVRRRETCDPLCMILYVCFDGNSSEEIASQLCSNEGLNIIAETLRTSSSVGSVEDYWLKLLVSRLCVEGDCVPSLFSKLAHKNETFTSEHAFLLRMVSDIANERLKEVSIPKDTAHFVLGVLKQSVEVFDFVSCEKTELPTGSAVIDVMGYSLVIIRDSCAGGSLEELKNANNDDSGGGNVEMLLSSGLIELLLDLLRKLEPPTTIKKALKQSPTTSSSGKPCPYIGFRRDIVAVIGNCAYRRKEVQDDIRERDGLFVMLQQCVTDDENPFLREWGLWCVRNLLEGNEENQKVVAELEMQGSVDVPQLREIGLRVEIDSATSRPKLVNDTT